MKLLILSLTRSGSKLLQSYIHNYLKCCGSSQSFIIRNSNHEAFTGLDEFLSPGAEYSNVFAYIQENGIINFNYKKIVDPTKEAYRRIEEIIKPLKENCVVKHRPSFRDIDDKNLSANVIESFDRIIILKRINSFERSLSQHIATHFNSYSALDNRFKNAVNSALKDPIIIDEEKFLQNYKWGVDFVNDNFKKFYQHKDCVEITFEQLITLKKSKELCNCLKLPYANFELNSNYFPKEYGELKFKMIKNLDRLKLLTTQINESIM